jgi:hypothetical protein
MSHVDVPSYTYLDTVDLHEVCTFIYSSDSPVNEKLNELGSPVGSGSIGCAGLALAGTAVGGGPGFVVGSVICAGSTIGCALEGIIEESTSCGNVQAEVYVASNPTTTSPNVMVVPKCESGALSAGIEDFVDTAEDYGSGAIETGEDIADDISGGVDYVVNGGQDIAGDLADGAGDVIDEGGDLIGDVFGF